MKSSVVNTIIKIVTDIPVSLVSFFPAFFEIFLGNWLVHFV